MKHMIKVLCYFLFVMVVLYYGIREINYRNYQIIDNSTKEIVFAEKKEKDLHIYVFGEEITIEEETINYIENMINKIRN